MDSINMKEVFFNVYCPTCKYKDIKDTDIYTDDAKEEPCNECLTVPAREYSHKPINWEEE